MSSRSEALLMLSHLWFALGKKRGLFLFYSPSHAEAFPQQGTNGAKSQVDITV